MAVETERKFLVDGDGWRARATACIHIVQAYLALEDELEIRVRITDGTKASLTIKSADAELSRREFEYEIPVADAEALIDLRPDRQIRKGRHIVPRNKGRHWEIDVFEGAHQGLCLAEVELEEGEDSIEIDRPEWLGREVTGDRDYYNASLAQKS